MFSWQRPGGARRGESLFVLWRLRRNAQGDRLQTMNQLFYGDNLDVLRQHVKDESVDLVYLDPPFNSNQNYNVLFAERDGSRAAAQIQAFTDTWQWDEGAARAYQETVETGGRVSQALQSFRTFLGENDMLAYLAMMAPRLVELRRVMKPTASIYLHCDPTASHYLKMLMDAVFGPIQFRNEVIWKRRTGSSSQVHISKKFGACTDSILFYVKSPAASFHPQYSFTAEGYADYVEKFFCYVDADGRRYTLADLSNPAPRPNLMYEYKGFKPPRNGWAISRAKMEEWDREGRLHFPKNPGGRIRRKRFLDELKGKPIQSLWDDIEPIGAHAAERLGYPTQKPVALLERILSASSNEGDAVLDPFCGCGTSIDAAQKLKRKWVGIDITSLATTLIKNRLRDTYGPEIEKTYQVIGEPVSLPDAERLAREDPYQFQWWALGLVGARPAEQKKGADKGIDGRIFFHDEPGGPTKQIILSVKAGAPHADHVRDLGGVIAREHAEIGVLLTFEEPTRPMRKEAASAGFYSSPWGQHSRIQIITVGELLAGKRIDCPPLRQTNRTFKKAPRADTYEGEQGTLPMAAERPDPD
jgi:DNA modification methylase